MNAKNYIKDIVLRSSSDEFVIYHDDDFYHLFNDNIKRMISFLKDKKDFGGVALPRMKRVFHHISAVL